MIGTRQVQSKMKSVYATINAEEERRNQAEGERGNYQSKVGQNSNYQKELWNIER